MKKVVFSILILVFIFSTSVFLFGQKTNEEIDEKIINVNFCDLFKNEKDYSDKLIRVTAIYSFGFELSLLYCPNCYENNSVWAECSKDSKNCVPKKFRAKFHEKKYGVGKTLKVTLIGKYSSGGGFGHMGAYPKRFLIERVETAKVISESGLHYEAMPEKDKAKVNCVTESNKD